MKKYTVSFDIQDINARGLHFKHCKRTVSADGKEEATSKVEKMTNGSALNIKAQEAEK